MADYNREDAHEVVAKRRPLNERQKAFYRIFTFEDVTQKQAAIDAGYSAKSASVMANNLMKDPRGQEYMRQIVQEQIKIFDDNRQLQAEEDAAPILSAQWVLQNIVDLHDKSKRTVIDMFGNQKMEAPTVAAKCLEMGMRYHNILNGGGETDDEPEVMAISFSSFEPVDEVVITNGSDS